MRQRHKKSGLLEKESRRTQIIFLTGSPHGLMSALAKLELGAERIPPSHANPQTAHMFIVNPFAGSGSGITNLFRTHPPTRDRIARLGQLETGASQPLMF